MATHDDNGREYIKYDALAEGIMVEIDDGFDCMRPGRLVVKMNKYGPYIDCSQGGHQLDGQDDGDGYCVGVYLASDPDPIPESR